MNQRGFACEPDKGTTNPGAGPPRAIKDTVRTAQVSAKSCAPEKSLTENLVSEDGDFFREKGNQVDHQKRSRQSRTVTDIAPTVHTDTISTAADQFLYEKEKNYVRSSRAKSDGQVITDHQTVTGHYRTVQDSTSKS